MNVIRLPLKPTYPTTNALRYRMRYNGRRWLTQSLWPSEKPLQDKAVTKPTPATKYRKQSHTSDNKKEEKQGQDKSTQRHSRPPRNDEIKLKEVQLVDEQGKLHPPMLLTELLSQVNLKENYVQLVAHDKILVKILNKAQEYQKEKARKAATSKSRLFSVKEVQMTWGVAAHDFAHKLNKVRTELGKGHSVDIVFAPKKGSKLPSPQDIDAKVKTIMEDLSDLAKEQRTRTFERGVLTIHLTKSSGTTNV